MNDAPEYNGLRITATRVIPLRHGNDKGLLAFVSVVLNGAIEISDIKITVDRESRVRVIMPYRYLKYPRADGSDTIGVVNLINAEAREWLVAPILKAYYQELTHKR